MSDGAENFNKAYTIDFTIEQTTCVMGDNLGFAGVGSSYAMVKLLNAETAFLYNEADGDATPNAGKATTSSTTTTTSTFTTTTETTTSTMTNYTNTTVTTAARRNRRVLLEETGRKLHVSANAHETTDSQVEGTYETIAACAMHSNAQKPKFDSDALGNKYQKFKNCEGTTHLAFNTDISSNFQTGTVTASHCRTVTCQMDNGASQNCMVMNKVDCAT